MEYIKLKTQNQKVIFTKQLQNNAEMQRNGYLLFFLSILDI